MTSGAPRITALWIAGHDGSGAARHAVRWAIANAPAHQAAIRVLRLWTPDIPMVGDLDLPTLMDQARASVIADFARLAKTVDAGVPVDWTEEFDKPVGALLDASDAADLLVLGTRGSGRLKRLLLGSVSLQCASASRVPVAVIPQSAQLKGRIDRLVVGMDGSENAMAALRWALTFAHAGTRVHVVGVWEPLRFASAADSFTFEYLSEPARAKFDAAIDQVQQSTNTQAIVDREFIRANPTEAFIERGSDADLIVLGARGRGRLTASVLGSVTHRVLQQAPCPIVVVPYPPAIARSSATTTGSG